MNFTGNTTVLNSETENLEMITIEIFLLVISLVGLVTNSLSTVVWLTQVKTNSAALFIGCLSFADALYCLATLLFFIITVTQNTTECLWYTVREVILICENASRLMTVVVVAQRWMAVSRPLSMTRLCTLQRRVITLTFFSIPMIGILFYDISVIWFLEIKCENADFMKRNVHFLQVCQILNMAFSVLCFMCTLVFSALLIYATCTIHKVSSSARSRHLKRDLELRMSVSILCVSGISTVEVVLSFIFILDVWGFYLKGVEWVKASLVYMFASLVIRLVNFLVYSCIGKDFRDKLRSMCKCKCSSASE